MIKQKQQAAAQGQTYHTAGNLVNSYQADTWVGRHSQVGVRTEALIILPCCICTQPHKVKHLLPKQCQGQTQ